MIVYVTGTVLYVLFTYLLYMYKTKHKTENEVIYTVIYTLLFVLSIMPLGLISGLRYEVGTDYTFTYTKHFGDILTSTEYSYSEEAFVLLNKFLRLITPNPAILMMTMSFTFIIFLQLAITKISPNWMVSSVLVVACNLFAVSLNQSRQMMCVAILAYASTFISEKKWLKFILFTLLATAFHYASIVLLPFYWLVKIKFIKKYWYYVFLGLFVSIPLLCLGATFVVEHTKYAYYLTDPAYNTNQSIMAYFYMSSIITLFSILYTEPLFEKYGQAAYVYIILNCIATLIGAASYFIRIPELMARTYLMFSFSQIILIPMLVGAEKNKIKSILLLIGLCLAMGAGSSYVIIYQKHHEIFPYQWIF